jgi:hypothetical protein
MNHRSRIRIQVVAVAFILLPAVAGVLAVRASADCERFVRTYVTKPVRNRVSKQTAEAWANWRVGHPNWKPNPNLHRPKYVMNREESVAKVAFACSIPLLPAANDGLFKITELEPPPPIIDLSKMNPTQISLPEETPPEVAEITPDESWPSLGPFVPPILGGQFPGIPGVPIILPPVAALAPEPSSLVLLGSGVACMLLVWAIYRRSERKLA